MVNAIKCQCYAKTRKDEPGNHHANDCHWYLPLDVDKPIPLNGVEALRALEWTYGVGCEGMGFMGSGPPLHMHPACPACHQLKPDDDQRCFNKTAMGHKPFCWLNALIVFAS